MQYAAKLNQDAGPARSDVLDAETIVYYSVGDDDTRSTTAGQLRELYNAGSVGKSG